MEKTWLAHGSHVTEYLQSNATGATATMVIKDFVKLMSVYEQGKYYSATVRSDPFMVGDTPMVVALVMDEESKGFVSICLINQGDAAITVKCKVTTDVRSRYLKSTAIEPNKLYGCPDFLRHDECVNEYRDKDFVLTIQVVLDQKPSEDPEEFNVWEDVFTNMENPDFTLVFDGHEIPCHKIVLAASSPVLSAMVENQHTEAIQSQSCKMSQNCVKILGGWEPTNALGSQLRPLGAN